MNEGPTILMTCGAAPGVVGHMDAARGNGYAPVRIVVGDVSEDENVGFALADETVRIPPATDPDLVDKLLDICREHEVDVVWPVYDGELEPLAAARRRFESEGVRLLIADEGTVRLCLDKAAFYGRLADTGWVPICQVVRTGDELQAAAAALGYPRRRVAVKPTRGTGGRGFHVIDAGAASRARFLGERAEGTVCTLGAAVEALGHDDGRDVPGEILVMPFVEGAEYGCDVLAEDGEVVAAVTRRKLPPVRDGFHTRIIVDEAPKVVATVANVVGAIEADGLLSVDLREDEAGRLKVLEINPRAGAYLGMACVRIDLFGLALARLFEQPAEVAAFRRSSQSIVGVRYWADLVQVAGQPLPLSRPVRCEIDT